MNDSSAEIYDGYHIQGGLADRRQGAQAGRPGTKVQIKPDEATWCGRSTRGSGCGFGQDRR